MQDTSFLVNDINKDVRPSDDFFEYAVGSWRKNNPIPDDHSRWGAFDVLIEENYARLKMIAETAGEFKNTPLSFHADLVQTFYSLGTNKQYYEVPGIKPLMPYLEKIDAVKNATDVTAVVAELQSLGAKPFFWFSSTPDSKNSERVISGLGQGGLGLPERDYYVSSDPKMQKIREQYFSNIVKMFALIGKKEIAEHAARAIIKIETKLAEASRTKEALRDPLANYNKKTISDLEALVPNWSWKTYFKAIGLDFVGEIDVGQPEFFTAVGHLVVAMPLNDIKMYLVWHLLLATAEYLTQALSEERFNFFVRTIQGQPKQHERWKRVIMTIDHYIGQSIGRLYVQKYFPENAKARAEKLVRAIVNEMGERIKQLDWMSDQTKVQALEKLKQFKVKIGYPDWWIDYASLQLPKDSYGSAVFAAKQFEFNRDVAKIGKPVNHAEWFIPPQMVNAFYNPLDNEIVFPAGILQPPFFFADADDALNFGGIGAVIGHEITHGFDDQGRQYDGAGNLRDWWTKEDEQKFNARAQKLVAQFSSEKVLGEPVNGEFTLGENIADLGGLYVAYFAFVKTLSKVPAGLIDGFTPEQRFFLAHAQSWKQNIRPEKALLYLKVDPHAPDKYRTNIPLSNFPPFIETYGVKEGDGMFMNKKDWVVIW